VARIEHPLPAPAALRVQRDLATGVQYKTRSRPPPISTTTPAPTSRHGTL